MRQKNAFVYYYFFLISIEFIYQSKQHPTTSLLFFSFFYYYLYYLYYMIIFFKLLSIELSYFCFLKKTKTSNLLNESNSNSMKKKSRSKMQLNALSFSFFWRFCWSRICEYVEWPHLQQWLLWWVNQVLRHHGWLIVNVLVWYVWLLNLWMRYRLIQELRRLSIPWWQRSRRQQWHRHVHL